MDLMETIFNRRSIRKFTGQLVKEEDLKKILEVGFQAPSAHNREPREFVVIKNRETLEEIAAFHKYGKMLPGAGCAIVVCGDISRQKTEGFLVADCSASIQNMLLAVEGLGLGAVWCGIYPKEDLMEETIKSLNLPENIIPIGIIAVGEKAEEKKAIYRYREDCIHYDKWQK